MVSITKGKLPRLSLLQDPSYGVPADVTFQIIEGTPGDEGEETKKVLGEVKGHKVVLAAFSEVFKNMFFGPMKESKNIISVEQTTLESFEKLFDFIYNKDINWGNLTVSEIYDVVNLADKYLVKELMDELKDQMENLTLTVGNVMDFAHTASQFSQFPDVSTALLTACAKFVKKTIKTRDEQLSFVLAQSGSGQEATAVRLMVEVQGLASPICLNCELSDCSDGQVVVGNDKFRVGLQLRVNKNTNYWGVNGGDFAETGFTVRSAANGVNGGEAVHVTYDASSVEYADVRYEGVPTFVYNCA